MIKSVAINVPEIQKQIKSKHKKFLKDVGVFSHKISQDHQLNLTRLVAKITRIMECFIEEKIIDEFKPWDFPYASNEYIRGFRISKKEFTDSICLWTDGNVIVLGDSSFPIISSSWCENVRDIKIDTFDGVDFSKILLDYIHRKIYSRTESYEQSVFGPTNESIEATEDTKGL